MRPLAHPALIAPLAALSLSCAAEPVTVHFMPQAALDAAGVPEHPMAQRTALWAAQAGLSLRWQPVPFKRSLEELRRNAGPFCVLGVFDLPERRRYARFSLPLVPGEPQLLLVSDRVATQLRSLPDARSMLLDPRFELLAFSGVAYGVTLDRWISERPRKPLWANPGTAQVLPMLARGRADFTISAVAEWEALRAAGGGAVAGVQALRPPGMPAPPTRHLACSLSLPPQWLARFDAAARGTAAPAPH